jgi:hypothetical protein
VALASGQKEAACANRSSQCCCKTTLMRSDGRNAARRELGSPRDGLSPCDEPAANSAAFANVSHRKCLGRRRYGRLRELPLAKLWPRARRAARHGFEELEHCRRVCFVTFKLGTHHAHPAVAAWRPPLGHHSSDALWFFALTT